LSPAIQLQHGAPAGRLLQGRPNHQQRRRSQPGQRLLIRARPGGRRAQPQAIGRFAALSTCPGLGDVLELAHQGGGGIQLGRPGILILASSAPAARLVPKRGSMVRSRRPPPWPRSRSSYHTSSQAPGKPGASEVFPGWWAEFSGAGLPGRCAQARVPLEACMALRCGHVKAGIARVAGAPPGGHERLRARLPPVALTRRWKQLKAGLDSELAAAGRTPCRRRFATSPAPAIDFPADDRSDSRGTVACPSRQGHNADHDEI